MAVLASVAACGDDDRPTDDAATMTEPSPTPTTVAPTTIDDAYPGTTLEASVVRDGDELSVRYTLANRGDVPLAVVVALPDQLDPNRPASPDSEGVWVTASTRSIVTVGRWGIGRPSVDGDAAPPLPIYASELAPGATVDGAARVAWPLSLRRPYLATDAPPIPTADPLPVRVCIGVGPVDVLRAGTTVDGGGSAVVEVSMDDLRTTTCSLPVAIEPG